MTPQKKTLPLGLVVFCTLFLWFGYYIFRSLTFQYVGTEYPKIQIIYLIKTNTGVHPILFHQDTSILSYNGTYYIPTIQPQISDFIQKSKQKDVLVVDALDLPNFNSKLSIYQTKDQSLVEQLCMKNTQHIIASKDLFADQLLEEKIETENVLNSCVKNVSLPPV